MKYIFLSSNFEFIRRIVDLNYLRTSDKFIQRIVHFIRWIALSKLRTTRFSLRIKFIRWIATYPPDSDLTTFRTTGPADSDLSTFRTTGPSIGTEQTIAKVKGKKNGTENPYASKKYI